MILIWINNKLRWNTNRFKRLIHLFGAHYWNIKVSLTSHKQSRRFYFFYFKERIRNV